MCLAYFCKRWFLPRLNWTPLDFVFIKFDANLYHLTSIELGLAFHDYVTWRRLDVFLFSWHAKKGTRLLKKAIMIKLQIHQTQAIQSITASCRRLGSCRQQHFLVIELLVFYSYQIRILKPLVAFADKIIFILHSQVSWLNLQKNTPTFSQKVCFLSIMLFCFWDFLFTIQ